MSKTLHKACQTIFASHQCMRDTFPQISQFSGIALLETVVPTFTMTEVMNYMCPCSTRRRTDDDYDDDDDDDEVTTTMIADKAESPRKI
jgi:hypothetical protein